MRWEFYEQPIHYKFKENNNTRKGIDLSGVDFAIGSAAILRRFMKS